MQAGQIDGMINDLVSTLLYNQTAGPDRHRALCPRGQCPGSRLPHPGLASSGITGVDGLRGVPIGVSEGTVIEYVTDRLLQAEGLTADDIEIVAVPKIPDRMALLESGELKAATLPDPLSSLALQAGAKLILDDTAHPEYGTSVLSFRKAIVDENPEAVRAFLRALETATAEVNADPGKWSTLLTENKLVPAPLLGDLSAAHLPHRLRPERGAVRRRARLGDRPAGWSPAARPTATRSMAASCPDLPQPGRDPGSIGDR